MDNRLVFAVLFVTLSLVAVGTYATNTTMAPNVTATATAANAQTTAANNMTTGSGNNMTGASNATVAPTVTTAPGNNNMTGASNATVAPTVTTAPGNNVTGAPNATVAPIVTTGSGNNMTGAPSTSVPPIVPNTTVETLQTTISRARCGTEQLCAGEPSSCDPSTDGSCFFLAAKRQNGQNFEFALAGESDGYLAATLSTDSALGGNDTTYVCAISNGVVQFFGALLNDGKLVRQELNVNSVKGRVTGRKIQCTFAATVPISRARTTRFTLGISTGTFDSTSGNLGPPQTQLRSNAVNLANPSATVTNEVSTTSNSTTSSPNTTPSNHAITFQQSLTQALLISAAVLSLIML
ncbi:putative ferric-chelate reductase 1 [Larimichthys crocea]|uniref:putative ferric-chelate reductase 1 n=1 Tax=Larimichthys crocea TaxID=215358 RepID=UPI000F5F9B5E|nr:putative ferric-chelate reductase 1 [Larimichthys crocea]